ncbi:Secreted frizzled-related protein 4 [Mactra antiquata]
MDASKKVTTMHRCVYRSLQLSVKIHLTVLVVTLGAMPTCAHVIHGSPHQGLDMCEPIEIPLCANMPYNMTRMPNHLHHSTQENARLAIEPYEELVKQNCSGDILFFLCAMFAPICTPHFQADAIPPCRSVCERSKLGCEPLMNKYNFSWPSDLNCDILPEYEKGVCVSPEAIVSSIPTDTSKTSVLVPIPPHKPTKDCECTGRSKPTKQAYRKGNYNYAIGCVVRQITHMDENTTVIRVTVNTILQRGKVHLRERRDIDLWVDSECVCPALKLNKQYLIIGEEDVLMNKLKYNENSLVSRWKQKWEKKFKTWSTRKKKKGRGKKNNKRCKKDKCRKKNSKCRPSKNGETNTRRRCRDQDNKSKNNSTKRERNNKRRREREQNSNSTGR